MQTPTSAFFVGGAGAHFRIRGNRCRGSELTVNKYTEAFFSKQNVKLIYPGKTAPFLPEHYSFKAMIL